MKDYLIYFILLTVMSCNAQNPIIGLLDKSVSNANNRYEKDLENDLDPFVGTYVFEEGNIYVKVILKKLTMTYNQTYYEDVIVGEIQYKVNGVDLFNSLSKIDIDYPNQSVQHAIGGNSILLNSYKPECYDCAPNEKRLRLMFSDGKAYGSVVIQRITVGGNLAIKFEPGTGVPTRVAGSPVVNSIVKNREYIMMKQP